MKACPKPPMKEVLIQKLSDVCIMENYNIAWIDEKHIPDKKWLIDALGTLKPDDEILEKNYVAPPIRKKLNNMQTIVLLSHLFEDIPSSKSKAQGPTNEVGERGIRSRGSQHAQAGEARP